MQRLYAIEFVCGGAMAGVFAVVFLWSLLPVARIESDLVLYVMVPLIAVYLPLNLLLAYLNRRSRRLRLPAGLSAKAFKRTSGGCVCSSDLNKRGPPFYAHGLHKYTSLLSSE